MLKEISNFERRNSTVYTSKSTIVREINMCRLVVYFLPTPLFKAYPFKHSAHFSWIINHLVHAGSIESHDRGMG